MERTVSCKLQSFFVEEISSFNKILKYFQVFYLFVKLRKAVLDGILYKGFMYLHTEKNPYYEWETEN